MGWGVAMSRALLAELPSMGRGAGWRPQPRVSCVQDTTQVGVCPGPGSGGCVQGSLRPILMGAPNKGQVSVPRPSATIPESGLHGVVPDVRVLADQCGDFQIEQGGVCELDDLGHGDNSITVPIHVLPEPLQRRQSQCQLTGCGQARGSLVSVEASPRCRSCDPSTAAPRSALPVKPADLPRAPTHLLAATGQPPRAHEAPGAHGQRPQEHPPGLPAPQGHSRTPASGRGSAAALPRAPSSHRPPCAPQRCGRRCASA